MAIKCIYQLKLSINSEPLLFLSLKSYWMCLQNGLVKMIILIYWRHESQFVCIWCSRCDLVVFVFQCASLVEWGESFVFHVVSRDFQLEQPKPSVTCQHGVDRRVCDAKVLQKHAHLHLSYSHHFQNDYTTECVSVRVACCPAWSLSHIRGSEVHHDSTNGWRSPCFHCWTRLCSQY